MPALADDPAAGGAAAATSAATDAGLLERVMTAIRQDRHEEAAGLLEQIGPGVRHLCQYWQSVAAVAAGRGEHSAAAAAQARASTLYRELNGTESPTILLDLARLGIAAKQGEVAREARDRAAAAIASLKMPDRSKTAEWAKILDALDQGLAALLWQEGQHDAAIAAQVRHAATAPDDLTTLRQLRRALATQDRLLEALLVQMRVALLVPDVAGPARDMGQILRALGAETAARSWFRRALALQPDDALAQTLLDQGEDAASGVADPLFQRLARPIEGLGGAAGDPVWPMAIARVLTTTQLAVPTTAVAADWTLLVRDAAVAALRRVLALRPNHAEAAAALAELLQQKSDDTAPAALRGALKLAPRNAELHVRLGFELFQRGQMQEAQRSFRTALSLDPDQPMAMLGLAGALHGVGPSEEALGLIRRVQALDPTVQPIWARLGLALALHSLCRMEEAVAAYQAVLDTAPDNTGAQFGLGLARLAMGQLEEGWAGYAWRWRANPVMQSARAPHDPLQRPDPAAWKGRTVLLYAEQALGDTIQFLRYARIVAATGARVLLEVHRPLKRLAETIPDLAGVYAREDLMPPFDVAVPLLQLPWAFGTTLETIPSAVPYLRGDLTRAAGFRRRLAGLPGLKVGLVWAGEPRPDQPEQASMDARRSVKLKDLAPLAKVPGVVFVSLQKGVPAAQAADPPAGMVLHDWTEELADFTDTAALMTALDLVIAVDTAPAHLAGALARPVWLLNRFDTDFRWLLDRDDSPWYPTLRQFRQVRPGAWDEVIERVAVALRERVGRGA